MFWVLCCFVSPLFCCNDALLSQTPFSTSTIHPCTPGCQVNIMKDLRSANVVLFMGVCLSPLSIVTEYCSHGSLYDVIKRARDDPRGADARRLTWARRVSMARDAAAVRVGVMYRCNVFWCGALW